jgi:hypothetical protein
MIDMQLNHDQVPGATMLGGEVNEGPKFPRGLTICLDNEALKKLAMSLPQVGQTFVLDGVVEVVAVRKSNQQIEDSKEVELQITHLGLESVEEEMNEQQKAHAQISRMYG